MSVIVAQAPLQHLLDRMKVNYVPPELYSDADILVMLNDAYLEACERTRCLKALATITLVDDQAEYALPTDFSQMDQVCSGGRELSAVSLSEALIGQETGSMPLGGGGYYLYGSTLGFIPTPTALNQSGVATMIAYSAKPAPLLSYEDAFDARFPTEFADMLLHYVVWRVQSMSGGAEALRNAQANRALSDTRTRELRRTVDLVDSLKPRVLQHVSSRHLGANV